MPVPTPPTRRTVLRAAGGLGLGGLGLGPGLGGLASCAPADDRRPVVLATGSAPGVYASLGASMVARWGAELGIAASVRGSDGSVANVGLLGAGEVDVAFCAIDVATDAAAGGSLQALARVHDDALQVVVDGDSPARRLADLAGRRVSVGAPGSGVLVIAPRLLATAGLDVDRDLDAVRVGLDASLSALGAGELDAFFWSGGLPTAGVDALAATRPVRLLDLTAETAALRARFGVYDVTTVPARTYRQPAPITTASVRNVLLVRADMAPRRAEALTRVLLDQRARLALADPAGRAIDPRAAIGTQPVDLHPGAITAYRALKGR